MEDRKFDRSWNLSWAIVYTALSAIIITLMFTDDVQEFTAFMGGYCFMRAILLWTRYAKGEEMQWP